MDYNKRTESERRYPNPKDTKMTTKQRRIAKARKQAAYKALEIAGWVCATGAGAWIAFCVGLSMQA
jgi:hypothetical protein